MIGSLLSWLCGFGLLILAGLFVWVVLRHNLRVKGARRAYRNLPEQVKSEILQLIQNAARDRPYISLLLPDNEQLCDGSDTLQSHVGGLPYAEAGEEWPNCHPGTFLVQVRLDEPGLGQNWQGRLLTVFLAHDIEQVVRCYAAPSPREYVPLAAPVSPAPCVRLRSIRIPIGEQVSNDDEVNESTGLLADVCRLVPAIPELLKGFTNDPVGVVTQILCPNTWSYDLAVWQLAFVGGEPQLIQNPHDPICDECGQPMRFLFHFGEIIPGLQLADAGVCYVYGCDEHPHNCKGFIDSH
jgi:hypothetical protein